MAADSDGCSDLETVLTCEGDLSNPNFVRHFRSVVGKLNGILGEAVKVRKLEPWNSVRVTLSIPREAALRLRKLANEGSAQLRALGILSVQVEGDQVISLRVANSATQETQEIRIQTTQDGSGSSQAPDGVLGRFLGTAPAPEFKSPNVVCPADSVVPVPKAVPNNALQPSSTAKIHSGPFPFTSMNQAIHYATPPPPYPGKPPQVTAISSPLLVNLLQNDGKTTEPVQPQQQQPVSNNSAVIKTRTVNLPRTAPVQKNTKQQQVASTCISPSALSTTTNTSISKPNSTITNVLPPYLNNSQVVNQVNLPPPPPYSVAVNSVTSNNSRQWTNNTNNNNDSSLVQNSPFLDLTPSLTDLKADDLEHLLPSLERDLARSPPEFPEELTQHQQQEEKKKNFLINPLTGELEPQSSCESDNDEMSVGDVFTGLPSPAPTSDDDDDTTTSSTIRPDTTTDQSDSETRSSSHSDSGKQQHRKQTKVRGNGNGDHRVRDASSPNLKPTEKIKLRLKLEKSEPINSAYKVDVSFIQQPKKATSSVVTAMPVTTPATPGEELRVPPLHISLRGRNHAFITNKKKKLNPDKPKVRKTQDLSKIKKDPSAIIIEDSDKNKKFKSNHEHELLHYNNKEKQKERRGSDSELSRTNLKFDSNGIISVEKKQRRLSQSEPGMMMETERSPPILGSTNVGTIAGLPQKPRKDKNKIKDIFKGKDVMRNKSFTKSLGEKFTKQVTLPTGEIDMEAKFKQRLMEGTEKGIPRPPHRTEIVQLEMKSDQVMKVESEPPPLQEKSPDPVEKCSKQSPDLTDKVVVHHHHHHQSSRSPNGGAQGEDSGIESMDALSEKSPNQASQSPHADIPETPSTAAATITTTPNHESVAAVEKTKVMNNQVPEMQMADIMDIEAQLAKMEGLNGVEDVNENCRGGSQGQKCCELTAALQDSLKTTTVMTTATAGLEDDGGGGVKQKLEEEDVGLVKLKTKEEDLEPLPLRVTPPLYTYSNPEKSSVRAGSESPPPMSDDDSNSACSNSIQQQPPQQQQQPQQQNNKTKSLLEQLLIEIPDNNSQTPSSPSPATRTSMRTRAHSKVGSPELNSPVTASSKGTAKATPGVSTTKRKRHESDSSNNSLDDVTRSKKTRKCSENAAELIKACMGVDGAPKMNNVKKGTGVTPPSSNVGGAALTEAPTITTTAVAGKLQDESSDSDEPLIEKVRKTAAVSNNSVAKKVKSGGGTKGTVNTRRSVRTAPATNTRSKGDKVADNTTEAALRRKTRSAVSEGDSKRKKEVK